MCYNIIDGRYHLACGHFMSMSRRLQDCLSPNCLFSRRHIHAKGCSSPSCSRFMTTPVRNPIRFSPTLCSDCTTTSKTPSKVLDVTVSEEGVSSVRSPTTANSDLAVSDLSNNTSTRADGLVQKKFLSQQVSRPSVAFRGKYFGTEPLIDVRDGHDQVSVSSLVNRRSTIYQNLLLLLIAEVSSKGSSDDQSLRETLLGYLDATATLDAVSGLLQSHDYRAKLSEVLSYMGISDDPRVREALRLDEEEKANLLVRILISDVDTKAVLSLEGENARLFVDVIQNVLDNGFLMNPQGRMARQLLIKLSETCDILPSSLLIKGVTNRDEEAITGGDFTDVYRASYNGEIVALKRLRIFHRDAELHKIRRKLCQEALLWQNLRHPYVLPFLGIDSESFPSFFCMVSPWMRHGAILDYFAENGKSTIDRNLYEISQGLAYLHSRSLVHGDLRGSNILITDESHACLADFGLTNTSSCAGGLRWMAPELHLPKAMGLDTLQHTYATDVYAFGCLCLELYTGHPPFMELAHDAAVMMKVVGGERPRRPLGESSMSDTLWSLVELSWNQKIADRPSASDVIAAFESASRHNELLVVSSAPSVLVQSTQA